MSTVNERIELLIIRRLDGELTPADELELDRELIKSPEARTLLEEYRRIDAEAASALSEALAERVVPLSPAEPIASSRPRAAYSRAWWLLPLAVAAAAALVISFMGLPTGGPEIAGAPVGGPNADTAAAQPRTPAYIPEIGSGVYQAGFRTDLLDRATDTESLYILGNDGNVYVIEQQRIRTARTPNSGIRRVSGDL